MSSASRRILIGGGARSGKSSFALDRARALGERRVFVATARALDDEMRTRVERHRLERAGAFATVEEDLDLPGALARLGGVTDPGPRPVAGSDSGSGEVAPAPDVAVVDCLTLWLANLLLRGDAETEILAQVDRLARVIEAPPCHLVLVSNEVGFGVVPDNALGRAFRDLVGHAHQRVAPLCDELYLAALGTILRLRPEPVAVVPR